MTSETEFDATSRLLTDTLAIDPPPDVDARLRRRLDELRTKLESPATMPSSRRRLWRTWYAGAAALATVSAAALLMAVLSLSMPSSSALAQIVEAVAAKTWLHASGKGPDGRRAEMWFSAKKGIMAFRSGESFVLVDQVQGTMDVFGEPAATGTVQRMPLEHVDKQGVDAARQSFLALLGGDLQQAMKSPDRQVLEHSSKSIRVDGRELIEHLFVVGRKGEDEARSVSTLHVDPQTDLPISWQMRHGDKLLFDFQVSYPERGPLSIVALGAPQSAKIVDLAPQGELKQVLAANRAARLRFDDYHAVVIESNTAHRAHGGEDAYRIWRKGNRWRVDLCQWKFGNRDVAPEGVDSETWWLEQVRTMKSYPREINDGRRIWNFEPRYALPRQPDPADPQFRQIESLQATSRELADRHDPRSAWFMLNLPEFYGYEHLSRGVSFGFRAETRPVVLDKLPHTLVDIINTRSDSPRIISPERFWLDPRRGNLMVRKAQFRVSDPEKSIGASEVTSAARTPQGIWYPTTVRLIGNTTSLEDGSRGDSFVRYYLEFDTEIPDELFDAELVDAKDFWTKAK